MDKRSGTALNSPVVELLSLVYTAIDNIEDKDYARSLRAEAERVEDELRK